MTTPQEVSCSESTRNNRLGPTVLGRAIRLPLIVHEGHLVVEVEGRRALIDTGCPETLGRGVPLSIGGRSFELHESFHGITVESISEPVGCPFEIVIGMDVLSSYDVTFSFKRAEVVLWTVYEPEGDVVRLGSFFGAPTIPIEVNSEMHKVIFDTGAPVSYLSERFIREFELIENRTDFFPLWGTFETAVRRVPVTIGSTERMLPVGGMNGVLSEMLEPSGMPGILGTEIFKLADVTLSMARNAITLTWHEET